MRLKNYLFDNPLRRLAASLALAAGAAICIIPSAYAQKRPGPDASADDVFVALRAAAASDNGALAQELAARLTGYDLTSYVDYYRLKPRVRDYSASEQEVRDFLTRYEGQAIV